MSRLDCIYFVIIFTGDIRSNRVDTCNLNVNIRLYEY